MLFIIIATRAQQKEKTKKNGQILSVLCVDKNIYEQYETYEKYYEEEEE